MPERHDAGEAEQQVVADRKNREDEGVDEEGLQIEGAPARADRRFRLPADQERQPDQQHHGEQVPAISSKRHTQRPPPVPLFPPHPPPPPRPPYRRASSAAAIIERVSTIRITVTGVKPSSQYADSAALCHEANAPRFGSGVPVSAATP